MISAVFCRSLSFAEFDTTVICSFLLQDMLLSLQVFAFKRQNIEVTLNMLLTCILYGTVAH